MDEKLLVEDSAKVQTLLGRVPGDQALNDPSLRLVPPGEKLYRFSWVLQFRTPSLLPLQQYTRVGDSIFQRMFGKLPNKDDIKAIDIYDISINPPRFCYRVEIDSGNEADILYNVTLGLGTRQKQARIYTFGARDKVTKLGKYLHIQPVGNEIKTWVSANRIA